MPIPTPPKILTDAPKPVAGVPHPIPYQGSKRLLAKTILSFFPMTLKGRLLEPFSGSAAVSLAAAHSKKAKRFVLNDRHEAVASLWKEIVSHPDRLAADYATIWKGQLGREIEHYNFIRARFNQDHSPADFLFLLARCVKSAVRYNSSGEFNNSPDKRRLGTHPETMECSIHGASRLFKGQASVHCEDYKTILDMAKPGDLVYMDPPYQGTSGPRDQRYCHKVGFDDFATSLDQLNRKNVDFIVSYDGRMGDKSYGQRLPDELNLTHIEVLAGKSTQATLLGKSEDTFEAIYLSPGLAERWDAIANAPSLPLFAKAA